MNTVATSINKKVDGNGNQATFFYPYGIYFDSSSNSLIIADLFFASIRKMNQSGLSFKSSSKTTQKLNSAPLYWTKGYTTTVAGYGALGTNDGQGTLAHFYQPFSVTMDSIGNIYVGDYCAIRMINSTGF